MATNKRFLAAAFAAALAGVSPAAPQPKPPDRLQPGIRLTRTLEGSAIDRMIIPVAAGQFARIEVIQAGADVGVALKDTGYRTVAEVNSPNGRYGPETIATIVESDGDYSLEVTLTPAISRGSYTVTLVDLRNPTPSDRDLVAAHRLLREALQLRAKQTADSRRSALQLLGQARDAFAALGSRYYQALTMATTGATLAESGDFRAALVQSEQATSLFHELGDRSGEAVGRNNIGGMLDVLGDPQKALDSYRQARNLHRLNTDLGLEALVLSNIGKIQSDFGDFQKALEHYQAALSLATEAGDSRREALLHHNLGTAYLGLRDLEQSSAHFQRALAMRRAAKDKRGEGDTLREIGSVLREQKQPAQALESYHQALLLYLELGDRRAEADTRRLMGRAYTETGRYAEAEDSIRQSLALERSLQRRRSAAQALFELARVQQLSGKPNEAVEPSTQALSEFRAIGDRNYEAMSLELLARAESDLGKLTDARAHTEEALHLVEDVRGRANSQQLRASFFASRQDSYGFYIDLLMRLHDANAALTASERSHARSLLEMLAEAGSDIREGADPKLLLREREISNLLNSRGARLLPLLGSDTPQAAALKKEVGSLESEFQEVQAAIRKSSPRYAALTQPSPLTAAQIQSEVLDADSVLLEYSLGEKRSYLWAITENGVHSWELPPRETIEAQVAEVYTLLTARSAAPRTETSAERQKRISQADAALPAATRRLSEMLLAPAAAALAGKRLIVVPDGALQRLPFGILPLPGSPDPLIAAHEVVMLPSASALSVLRAETAGRKPAPKLLAVFADPVFSAGDAAPAPDASRILEHLADTGQPGAVITLKIPRLPYTAREADQILREARGGSNWRAVGYDASRAAATGGQLSQYRYLHFATHGYLDTESPSLSALVLSQIDPQGKPQDGFLRVNDIYNSRLSADLVVLSACQTGLGKEVRGEGLMGLTRAFLYAGAPRVVVSLWNVNDRATADLMAALYRGMLREGKSPAAALRAAQLELRKQKRWESPYYWAAFVQHGEWR